VIVDNSLQKIHKFTLSHVDALDNNHRKNTKLAMCGPMRINNTTCPQNLIKVYSFANVLREDAHDPIHVI